MGEVTQNGEVVAKVFDLTPNQLMILLAIYSQSDAVILSIPTFLKDLEFLNRLGIIESKKGLQGVRVSEVGVSYIKNVLTIIVEP